VVKTAAGWLEPLLDRIAENRSFVVVPVIDNVVDATFQLSKSDPAQVGGFNWELIFTWHDIPDRERKRRTSAVDPVWLGSSTV
jgi:polypeptide N-acetylgalactosaminyltransferase